MATEVPTNEIKSMSISDSDEPSTSSSSSSTLSYQIITSVGKECITDHELLKLLSHKSEPVCYDGFEPSGRMHIAERWVFVAGYSKSNQCKQDDCGRCRVKILVADWFALLNNKMGGDLEKIETVGRYYIEIWKSVGMNLDSGKVEFLWSSKEINARPHEYWPRVMDIARCRHTMGRTHLDELTAAHILYPCMQCADILFLEADICQMGMDQYMVNALAREYCNEIHQKKPIILPHYMLPGLQKGQDKMSKSDLSSCIFMEDDEVEVITKIKNAYCPPLKVEGNPCLDIVQYLIFPWFHEFIIEGCEKNGEDRTFSAFETLSFAYTIGEVHPGDLKPSLAKALNKILEPVRSHFKNDEAAKRLLQSVKNYGLTR